MDTNNKITKEDFLKALDKVVPSISLKDKEKYENVLFIIILMTNKINLAKKKFKIFKNTYELIIIIMTIIFPFSQSLTSFVII